jgi:alpha-beta hydrolase superfamily lysophospholipase
LGRRGASILLNDLSFGAFNKPFEPARTPFDWLSRDDTEVDKFISDPLCGFPASVHLFIDVTDGLAHIARPSVQARVPKSLLVHIIAGTHDPDSRGTKTPTQLIAAYRSAGLQHVTHRFYPEARHELINETNRDEVTKEVLGWLDSVIG